MHFSALEPLGGVVTLFSGFYLFIYLFIVIRAYVMGRSLVVKNIAENQCMYFL